MILLIDPPVGPYHPLEKLREWEEELVRMRQEHAGDEEAVAEVDRHLRRARRWIQEAETP